MDKTKRKRNRNKNTSDTKSRRNDQPRTAETDNNNLNVNNHVAESSVSSQAQIEEIRKSLDLVTKKLSSSAVEERLGGCESLAVYASQAIGIPMIMESDVPRLLVPLIGDSCRDVQRGAVGALRNLSLCLSVCDALVDLDIIATLVTLVKQYNSSDVDLTDEVTLSTLEQAVHLLWNLCESSPRAVQLFNDSKVVLFLLKYLKPTNSPTLAITVAVAQCVNTVSDSNPELHPLLRGTSVFNSLTSLLDTQSENNHQLLLRVCVAGILQNICDGSDAHSSIVPNIVDLITNVIATNVYEDVKNILTCIQEKQHSDSIRELTEQNSYLLTAQQLSLEMLANYCTQDVDDEDVRSLDSEGSLEDITDRSGSVELMETCDLSDQLTTLICGSGQLEKVLSLACPQNVDDVLKTLYAEPKLPTTQNLLQTVQCRALVCAANLLSVTKDENLGGIPPIYEAWTTLVQRLQSDSRVDKEEELLQSYTMVLRALAEKLAKLQAPQLTSMTEAEFIFLRDLAMQCSDVVVKVNVIRMMCAIGCVLAVTKNVQLNPTIQLIGSFLIGFALLNTVPLHVNAEALDSIFDVFSEDHLEVICVELDLLERLKVLVPVLKQKFKEQRKSLGEHFPLVSTVRSNLVAFIEYKSK